MSKSHCNVGLENFLPGEVLIIITPPQDEILKKKFGEDVVIKKFEKPKSWLNKKLSGASENQIENLLNILEEKSIWQRYGF